MTDNPALLRLAQARRVLLLQGPVGPFFDRLTRWLWQRGATVHRVAFQPGDRIDCRALAPIAFRGSLNDWPETLAHIVKAHNIDCLVLFGQARAYHAIALDVARRRDLPVVVLEEGYLRPSYATMELNGVNGHSNTLQRYRWCAQTVPSAATSPAFAGFRHMAFHAARHYCALNALPAISPHYVHHRRSDLVHHALHWWRTGWRWWIHRQRDAASVEQLGGQRYFFFPLQNEGDAQITQHSPFLSVEESVAHVLASFARHAPPEALLVLSQHPWSRGLADPALAVRAMAERMGIAPRVIHLHKGDTERLVERSAGVVVVNSTVGLLALRKHRPLMVLGEAVYRRPQLTANVDLDRFWRAPRAPDPRAVDDFLRQLIGLTQVPCDLYAPAHEPLDWRVCGSAGPTGKGMA